MPHQFTFEQYASFNKLEKDAKAEDHASELKKMSEMDYESLFSKFGEDAIAAHTVVELKEELKKLELSTAGRKQELVERLAEHLRSSHKRKADDSTESDEKKQKVDFEGKNPGNVIGGYKAAAHNPNLPEESREKAEQVLESMGVDPNEKAESTAKLSDGSIEGKNPGNVAGGFKATLHNENASEEAKEHAQEMLDKMGVDAEEKAPRKDDDKPKDEAHVIAGYKATLSNESASKEAKDHARKVLEEMGVNPDERVKTDYSSTEVNMEGKDRAHVIGGYKATLSNAEASDEAKAHARKVLEEMGVDPEERAADQSKSEYAGQVTADGRNLGNVVGGYKATLHNANASEEAKEGARAALEQIAKSQ
eukprot:TRINITY_DN10_c0_g1_i2.p1 TRINITY_DN10_c0_g1~~TRINITY_DN10_c0_g1_i2.p1  ORF type:complete len:365 (+),score=159.12 TRINITY_DN10_c0_g1_i2:227-1321(+)